MSRASLPHAAAVRTARWSRSRGLRRALSRCGHRLFEMEQRRYFYVGAGPRCGLPRARRQIGREHRQLAQPAVKRSWSIGSGSSRAELEAPQGPALQGLPGTERRALVTREPIWTENRAVLRVWGRSSCHLVGRSRGDGMNDGRWINLLRREVAASQRLRSRRSADGSPCLRPVMRSTTSTFRWTNKTELGTRNRMCRKAAERLKRPHREVHTIATRRAARDVARSNTRAKRLRRRDDVFRRKRARLVQILQAVTKARDLRTARTWDSAFVLVDASIRMSREPDGDLEGLKHTQNRPRFSGQHVQKATRGRRAQFVGRISDGGTDLRRSARCARINPRSGLHLAVTAHLEPDGTGFWVRLVHGDERLSPTGAMEAMVSAWSTGPRMRTTVGLLRSLRVGTVLSERARPVPLGREDPVSTFAHLHDCRVFPDASSSGSTGTRADAWQLRAEDWSTTVLDADFSRTATNRDHVRAANDLALPLRACRLRGSCSRRGGACTASSMTYHGEPWEARRFEHHRRAAGEGAPRVWADGEHHPVTRSMQAADRWNQHREAGKTRWR
jgi:hypothetical protein